jgi:hypothetical protein
MLFRSACRCGREHMGGSRGSDLGSAALPQRSVILKYRDVHRSTQPVHWPPLRLPRREIPSTRRPQYPDLLRSSIRVVESGRITPKWPQSASTMTNLADLPSYGGTNTASFAASTFASDTLPARESCKRFLKGSAFRPGGRRCCRLIAASRPGAT